MEQIKQRLNIVDVIGSYIKLTKAGANFKACCPFHSEKSPSFYVSPPREIWHCFGCNAGGDLFEFIKQIEGVEFPEALRILADRAGIKLVRQNPEFINEKTRLLDLLNDATIFYQKQLTGNKPVLEYLWGRGLKSETFKKFSLGFSPEEEGGWRYLFNYLKSKGYTGEEMEKAGLVIKKNLPAGRQGSDDYYDRFRGRIMFPLKDGSGRIVGFSGRVFQPTPDVGGLPTSGVGSAKYINTPQTVLYDKSRILYGFDLAKVEIRKQDACILVEGQMDVLMAHQIGTQNTVAVSGTALTSEHLEAIRRLTNNLIMSFDSDEAGVKAGKRSIDLALEKGFEVRALSLVSGKDPADVILENPEEWLKIVGQSRHIIDFYLDILEETYGKDPRRFKLEVGKNVLPYVLLISSEIEKNHWIKEIAKRINVKEEAVFEEVKKIKNPKKENMAETKTHHMGSRRGLLENRLCGIVLWKNFKKDELMCDEITRNCIFDTLNGVGEEVKNKLILEAELYYGGNEDLKKEIDLLGGEFKKEYIKEQLEKLSEEVKACEEKGDKITLEKKLSEFRKISKDLARS